mgnify:CR=1 FL=1
MHSHMGISNAYDRMYKVNQFGSNRPWGSAHEHPHRMMLCNINVLYCEPVGNYFRFLAIILCTLQHWQRLQCDDPCILEWLETGRSRAIEISVEAIFLYEMLVLLSLMAFEVQYMTLYGPSMYWSSNSRETLNLWISRKKQFQTSLIIEVHDPGK